MERYCLLYMEFQFCKIRVMEMDDGDGYTAMSVYLVPLNCTLKICEVVISCFVHIPQ